ncbi:MAG TPA: hypothetical protein VF256_14020 [Streptosporangiaceae bacterium]
MAKKKQKKADKKAEKAAKKSAKKAQKAAASAAKAQESATAGATRTRRAATSSATRTRGAATASATRTRRAATANVKKAQQAATAKRTIAHLPEKTRTALGKQGAAVAQRRRTGAASPKTRAELYEIAKRRDLPGRSKMGRDELAKALGEK